MSYSKVLLAALILCMIPAAAGEENITELRIDEIEEETSCGSVFSFSFSAGNSAGPPCEAEIDYWLGNQETRIVEGKDTIALGSGETRSLTSFLLIPEVECSNNAFFLKMQCNGAIALASRPIKISNPVDTTPKILAVRVITRDGEHEEFEFGYTIKSYREEPHPVTVEENIQNGGGESVWSSSQSIMLAGTEEFERHGPLLPPGQYTLSILLTRGNETARVTQDFDVEAVGIASALTASWFPVIPLTIVGLLCIALSIVIWKLYSIGLFRKPTDERGQFSMDFGIPGQAKSVAAIVPEAGEEEPSRNYVCLVESDSKGLLEENKMNKLLDDTGFSQEEKKEALEFAGKVPLSQAVRSTVFIDKFGKPNCETKMKITVSNETDKDWCDVLLLARIPKFLSENVSEVEAKGELQATKQGSILKLVIPRIDAMQAVTVSYNIAKWIPQEKVDWIPLPAVVNYSEGRPLVAKIEKVEKKAKEKRDLEKSLSYALSKKAEKKQSEKKKHKKR